MDPLERLRSHLVGVTCAACGRPYRPDRIRLLAQRDDLTFLELQCDRCGTDAVGLIGGDSSEAIAVGTESPTGGNPPGGPFSTEFGEFGEFSSADAARFEGAPALSPDDQLDVHVLLARNGVDLRSLVGGPPA
jgi:hypothetical protein